MLLAYAEETRLVVSPRMNVKRKSALGQFMTPASVARFMAAMFPPSALQTCKLLDPGAGLGALTSAFLDRWKSGGFGFSKIEATAHEIDDGSRPLICTLRS